MPHWFRPRGYKHFDVPVGEHYADQIDKRGFSGHNWSPLIHYIRQVKKYKSKEKKTVYKDRPIMYASHRDACILSKFSADLAQLLDAAYKRKSLTANVIGYRRLGKSNYDFSADAMNFAKANAPCVVLCFDITGFFDHLDHKILKDRLKQLLEVKELPREWFEVFRHVTKYRYVERGALANHEVFSLRMHTKVRQPIATLAELKEAGISIIRNPNIYGIPQGTPVSSAFSNLYMLNADEQMAGFCQIAGAMYQRYSDDIIVICSLEQEDDLREKLVKIVEKHKLEIKDEKTERAIFDPANPETYQYLGFNINPNGACIRPSSLARQWRKLKYSIKRTRQIGEEAIAAGKASKIYMKRLRRRFAPVGVRNFSAYSRRAGKAFQSKRVAKQVIRLERAADEAIRELNRHIFSD